MVDGGDLRIIPVHRPIAVVHRSHKLPRPALLVLPPPAAAIAKSAALRKSAAATAAVAVPGLGPVPDRRSRSAPLIKLLLLFAPAAKLAFSTRRKILPVLPRVSLSRRRVAPEISRPLRRRPASGPVSSPVPCRAVHRPVRHSVRRPRTPAAAVLPSPSPPETASGCCIVMSLALTTGRCLRRNLASLRLVLLCAHMLHFLCGPAIDCARRLLTLFLLLCSCSLTTTRQLAPPVLSRVPETSLLRLLTCLDLAFQTLSLRVQILLCVFRLFSRPALRPALRISLFPGPCSLSATHRAPRAYRLRLCARFALLRPLIGCSLAASEALAFPVEAATSRLSLPRALSSISSFGILYFLYFPGAGRLLAWPAALLRYP